MRTIDQIPLNARDDGEAAPIATVLKEFAAMLLYSASVFGLLLIAYGLAGTA